MTAVARRSDAVPLPHLHRDCAHPCHICTGTALALGSSESAASAQPRLHRDLQPHSRQGRVRGLPAVAPLATRVPSRCGRALGDVDSGVRSHLASLRRSIEQLAF